MALGLAATAQTATLDFEPQGKNVGKTNMQSYLGSNGQNAVFLQRKGLLGMSEDIVSFDMQQRETARLKYDNVRIDNTPERPLHEVMVNGDHLDLLITIRPKEGGLKVMHERRNIATLGVEGEPRTLATVDGNKNDNIFFFSATSPDGKLVAFATAKIANGMGTEVKVSLYSREFEEYWTMEVPAQGFNDLLVTDEGEVVMVGLSEKERRGRVQVSVADGEHNVRQQYTYDAEGMVLEWEPARYADGKLLLVALMRDDSKTFMRVGSDADCIDAITCDLNEGNVRRDRHRFSSEEICRLENRKGTKASYNWIQFANLVQVIGDKDGAFAVVDNQWDTYRNDSYVYRERRGMMVLRIGKEGRFEWVRTWRSYMKITSYYDQWSSYRWVATPDGIMLAWAQNQKDALLTGETAVKGLKGLGVKSNLEVICLGRDGNTQVTRFDIGKQGLMQQAWPLNDGSYLLYVGNNSKGTFGKLKLKD